MISPSIASSPRFFDEFEAVYSQFNQAQLSASLDNEQFLSLLKKLDDCKSYVATNPQVGRRDPDPDRRGDIIRPHSPWESRER